MSGHKHHKKHRDDKNIYESAKEVTVLDDIKELIAYEDDFKELMIPVSENDENISTYDIEKYVSNESLSKCSAKLIDSKVIPESTCTCNKPEGRNGLFIVKVPILLADFSINIDLDTEISLDEPVLQIKHIKKNVHLTHCKLIAGTGKLYIAGYVRESIEYSALTYISSEKINGRIKHHTQNVPFECITAIEFFCNPDLKKVSEKNNFIINSFNKSQDCETITSTEEEYFNEKIFYTLVSTNIFECYIKKEIKIIQDIPEESTFEKLKENTVLKLRIKLFQKQEINIHSI